MSSDICHQLVMLDLPLEVVELVCEYSSVDHLLNLRAVNSWLKDIATRAIPVVCEILECPGNDSSESSGSDGMVVAPALRIDGKELIWVGNNQKCWLQQVRQVVINFFGISLCHEAWECLQTLKLPQRVCVKFLQPVRISQGFQELLNQIDKSETDCIVELKVTAFDDNEALIVSSKVTCIELLISRQMIHSFVAPELTVSHPCSLEATFDLNPSDGVTQETNERDQSEYLPHVQSLYSHLKWKKVELRNVDHYCLTTVFSKIEVLTCNELTVKDYTDMRVVSSPIECHATEVTIERSSFLQIQSFNFPLLITLKLIDSPDRNAGEHISPNSGVWQNVLPGLPQLKHLTIKNWVLWDDSDLCTLLKGLVGSFNLETLHTSISVPLGMTHEDFEISDRFIHDLVLTCPRLQSLSFAESEEKPFYNFLHDDIRKLRNSSDSPEI